MDLGEAIASTTRSQDEAEGRLFGLLSAKVTNVTDPTSIGRVKARVLSMGDSQESDWLDPLLPGGIEALPAVGDKVYVLFVDGDTNRGCYLWSLSSKTKGRPIDAMLLGTVFIGLYNDLVGKFNNLKSKYVDLQSKVAANNVLLKAHIHTGGTIAGNTGVPSNLAAIADGSTDSDADAAKGKAADGSTPAAIAASRVVLSRSQKVR